MHTLRLTVVLMANEPDNLVALPRVALRESQEKRVSCTPLPIPIWKLLRPAQLVESRAGLRTFLHTVRSSLLLFFCFAIVSVVLN